VEKLNEEAKKLVAEIHPALVATADGSGRPYVSAKGSLRVLDETNVAFANLGPSRTVDNIGQNSKVCVLCLDSAKRRSCRIWGVAEILTKGELFEEFRRDLEARGMGIRCVVKVSINEVAVAS
jgi:pyridoxine/pyridoxamine 5'-phosphate oxidase